MSISNRAFIPRRIAGRLGNLRNSRLGSLRYPCAVVTPSQRIIPYSTLFRGRSILLVNWIGRMSVEQDYRISGHESFPCRYTWLPKAVQGLSRDPRLFADEETAMVTLGVGKNMVRSIRFWSQASGMAAAAEKGAGHVPTDFGGRVLGKDGLALKPSSKWHDPEEDQFTQELAELAARFHRVESIVFAHGKPSQHGIAIRLAITQPDGIEHEQLIHFTADEEQRMREIQTQFETLLTKDKRLGLAEATLPGHSEEAETFAT